VLRFDFKLEIYFYQLLSSMKLALFVKLLVKFCAKCSIIYLFKR